MGWRDRDYARTTGELQFRGRVVLWLIGVTAVAYFVQGALLGRRDLDLAPLLGVVPAKLLGSGWLWQLLTHALLHDPSGLQHIVYNMLFLYWLGTDLAEIYGARRFLALYAGGAVGCALVYAGAGYLTGRTGVPMIGASGAIMAVAVVSAFYFPNRTILLMFFLPLPLWLVVAGYVAIDFYHSLAGTMNGVASTGHLGGALFGFLFWLVTTRRGFRIGLKMPRMSLSSKPSREEVDRILDKINAQGIGSLTPAERKTLERAAE